MPAALPSTIGSWYVRDEHSKERPLDLAAVAAGHAAVPQAAVPAKQPSIIIFHCFTLFYRIALRASCASSTAVKADQHCCWHYHAPCSPMQLQSPSDREWLGPQSQ